MARYDLTPIVGEYLDKHMVFPLLEFLSHKKIYAEKELLQGKLDLISKTNMVDFAMEIYKELNETEELPESLKKRREEVVETLQQLQKDSQEILSIIENPNVISQLKQEKLFNLQFLTDNYNFRPEMVNTLYRYAKFQYDCGNYSGVAEMLYHFRILSTDNDMNLSALWGKLASEILTQNWDSALEDLKKLREAIDAKSATPLQQLQMRTWLIHWSLFVFFNHANGRNDIISMFLEQPAYLNTIQTACPHILRYLATAVITRRRRGNVPKEKDVQTLKQLVAIIQQETYTYRDPITEFVECLYLNFDFDTAQRKLLECEEVLDNDFFLVATREDFIENARLYIFEMYCRIHQCIDIPGLAQKLNMNVDDAEKWIVNLIRNARLDAKIDSKANTVVMGTQYQSVHQQVIERTKVLFFKSQTLASGDYQNYQQDANKERGERGERPTRGGFSGPRASRPFQQDA